MRTTSYELGKQAAFTDFGVRAMTEAEVLANKLLKKETRDALGNTVGFIPEDDDNPKRKRRRPKPVKVRSDRDY